MAVDALVLVDGQFHGCVDCLSKEISRLSAFRDSGSFERGRSKDFVFPATSMRSIIVQGFFRGNQCRGIGGQGGDAGRKFLEVGGLSG